MHAEHCQVLLRAVMSYYTLIMVLRPSALLLLCTMAGLSGNPWSRSQPQVHASSSPAHVCGLGVGESVANVGHQQWS